MKQIYYGKIVDGDVMRLYDEQRAFDVLIKRWVGLQAEDFIRYAGKELVGIFRKTI